MTEEKALEEIIRSLKRQPLLFVNRFTCLVMIHSHFLMSYRRHRRAIGYLSRLLSYSRQELRHLA